MPKQLIELSTGQLEKLREIIKQRQDVFRADSGMKVQITQKEMIEQLIRERLGE